MTEAFPLQWPAGRARRPSAKRKTGKFNRKVGSNPWGSSQSLSVADARNRLQAELERIGARYPVLSSNVELRLDGLPRSDRREPDDPAVAVYFQLAGKPHCLPCDTYRRVADNLAAVAAHIAATRAIERHGVASVAEMFSGFLALPSPEQMTWRQVLKIHRHATSEIVQAAYRELANARHPDHGGSDAMMAELNRARDEAMQELAQ